MTTKFQKIGLRDTMNNLSRKANDNFDKIYSTQKFLNETFGDDKGVECTGQFSVGSFDNPRELIVGKGDSTTHTMVALHTNDDVNFVDVTEILSSDSDSSTGLFGGTVAGSTIYVGADYYFNGVKVKIVEDCILDPNDIIAEYWDGTTWQSVNFMATGFNEQYAKNIASNGNGSEQWYFNADPLNLLTPPMPTTIDGIERIQWTRFRVVNPITQDAVLEQIKTHTDRVEIEFNGIMFYGRYRPTIELTSGVQNLINNTEGSAADQDVTYQTGITTADYNDNQFNNNATDTTIIIENIPQGMDTSIPLELNFSYYPESGATGDIKWEALVYNVANGYVYDGGDTPSVFTKIDSITVSAEDIRRSVIIPLDVSDLTDQDAIVVNLRRLANDPEDTLSTNVAMTNFRMKGYRWKY